MNLYFDANINNNLEKEPETSITVFQKKEDKWEKLLDPFYAPEEKTITKLEEWRKTITLSICSNHPIDNKVCKVTDLENGTLEGPTQVGYFKWEIQVITKYETWQDSNNTTFNVEITEGE